MNKIVSLQMSIFGSFDSIQTEPTLAAELIPLFDNKLVPSVIQLATVNPASGSVNMINRLNMLSSDGEINLAFLPDRINCNYSSKDAPLSVAEIETKLEELYRFLSIAAARFSAVGNRLAVNGRFVNTDISHKAADYLLLNPFFADKDAAEWSVSTNAFTHFTIGGSDEEVNNILELSLSKNNEEDTALMVTFDVNTSQSHTSMRFNADSLSEFLEQARVNLTEIISPYR